MVFRCKGCRWNILSWCFLITNCRWTRLFDISNLFLIKRYVYLHTNVLYISAFNTHQQIQDPYFMESFACVRICNIVQAKKRCPSHENYHLWRQYTGQSLVLLHACNHLPTNCTRSQHERKTYWFTLGSVQISRVYFSSKKKNQILVQQTSCYMDLQQRKIIIIMNMIVLIIMMMIVHRKVS